LCKSSGARAPQVADPSFSLNENLIGDAGAKAIAEMLKINATITTL
jgi:hypothetical protein